MSVQISFLFKKYFFKNWIDSLLLSCMSSLFCIQIFYQLFILVSGYKFPFSVFFKILTWGHFFIVLRERGQREREGGRETSTWERIIDWLLSCMPSNWGSNWQPGYVPWPGATPARARNFTFLNGIFLNNFWYIQHTHFFFYVSNFLCPKKSLPTPKLQRFLMASKSHIILIFIYFKWISVSSLQQVLMFILEYDYQVFSHHLLKTFPTEILS